MEQSIRSSSDHQMVQLSFSKKELRNEVRFTGREQNEFIYRGQHYDVVKINSDADHVSIICIADKKETALFEHFGNKLNEQTSANAPGKTSVKSVAPDWFFQIQTSEVLTETSALISSSKFFFLPNVLFKIPSPPPKGDQCEEEFFVA